MLAQSLCLRLLAPTPNEGVNVTVSNVPGLENHPASSQRGVSPGGAGGGLRRGRGLGDAADAALAVLIAGMDTRGGGAADCLLQVKYSH